MVSAKMFIIRNGTIEDFEELKGYEAETDRISEFDVTLKDTVENFRREGNEISFEFQSDLKSEREIRGKPVPYAFSYRAKIWCWFENNMGYMLIFGDNNTAKYISGKLQKIMNELRDDNDSSEILIEKLRLDTSIVLRIVQMDFMKINNSWWRDIGQELRSAFLSGRLKARSEDDETDENEIYKEIEEKAREITSVNFLSEFLGHGIVISRKRASIGSNQAQVTEQDIIRYFKARIRPYLDLAQS